MLEHGTLAPDVEPERPRDDARLAAARGDEGGERVRERCLLGDGQRAIDRDERYSGRRLDEAERGDVVPERRPVAVLAGTASFTHPGELQLERRGARGAHPQHSARSRAGDVHDAHRHHVPGGDGNLPAALDPELRQHPIDRTRRVHGPRSPRSWSDG